jgi:competence protein ComEC
MTLWQFWLAVVLGACLPLIVPALWPVHYFYGMSGVIALLGLIVWLSSRYGFKEHVFWKQWKPILASSLTCLFVLLLSISVAVFRIQDRLSHRWPESEAGKAVVLEGWVDDLPRMAEYGVRFSLRVTQLESSNGQVFSLASRPERVWLTSYFSSLRPNPKESEEHLDNEQEDVKRWVPRAGECWRMSVKLKPPHGLMNPHTFDMETWLFSHGFDATGSRVGRSKVFPFASCSSAWTDPLMQSLQRHRQVLKDRILSIMGAEAPYVGVLVALVIGDQPAIPDIQWQRFNATGIGHLISISGFHITFLAGLIAWIVRFGVVRSPRCMNWMPDRLWKAISGVLIAVVYVLLAGGGVPAQRTAFMMIAMIVASSLGQTAQCGALFIWSTLAVLCVDGLAPLSAGFWLSCVGVGALMLSGAGQLSKDVMLSDRASQKKGWSGFVQGMKQAINSQVIATVVLAPMTLYLFGQVSVASFLANALAIPVVSFLVTPLALLGTLCSNMDWALHSAHYVFVCLDQYLNGLVNNPIFPAVLKGTQPTLWATTLATLGLMYGCALKAWPGRWMMIVLSLLPLWVRFHDPVSKGSARLTILDVGQGLSVLIETANHRLLYDAGPRPFKASAASQADAGARVILPFMHGEGLDSLDVLMISHHDLDHRGGADSLLAQLPIDTLLTSDEEQSFPTKKTTTIYQQCLADQQWMWDDVQFTVLSPSVERFDVEKKSNDRSCVLRVATAEASALLPGDAEHSVEDELIQTHPEWLSADLLVAGHHGSHSSTSLSWLEHVQPTYVVFTSGYLNHYHHPHPSVVERVRQAGSLAWRSDQHGALTFELPSQGKVMLPRVWREKIQRAWNIKVGT